MWFMDWVNGGQFPLVAESASPVFRAKFQKENALSERTAVIFAVHPFSHHLWLFCPSPLPPGSRRIPSRKTFWARLEEGAETLVTLS
jgi:hypothetical protein